MRNLEEYNNKHEGKPCFILGGGCSVGLEDLTPLKNHVTIGVNSGYIALPDASFFISDDWAVMHWSFVFRDLKESKNTIALLYESKLNRICSWFGERSVLFRHKKGYELTNYYKHSDPKFHIWEARSSVGSAIHVAHIMGCNPIFLMGIDCCRYNGYRYFWQMPTFKNKPYRNDGMKIDTFVRSKIRKKDQLIESDKDLDSIRSYWISLKSPLCDKNIKIYNVSRISVLDVFPKMELQDALNV